MDRAVTKKPLATTTPKCPQHPQPQHFFLINYGTVDRWMLMNENIPQRIVAPQEADTASSY